jgi:TPR repeat protein
MNRFWRITVTLACVVAIGVGAFFWYQHSTEKAVEDKLADAVQHFRVRAQRGDAQAQSSLALTYYNGQGVPRDYTQAALWARKAAEQGDATGQYGLGVMYYRGQGVPQDYAEALRWYRKAAEQGHANAKYGLAVMYYKGAGVTQDYGEAARLYREAAQQGLADAEYALGNSYRKGQGVPRDEVEALRWYRKAAEQGDANARYALRLMQQGTPQGRRTHIVGFLAVILAVVMQLVPRRRWGRMTWLPWAVSSLVCTVLFFYELAVSALSLELLMRGRLFWGGFWRAFLLLMLGGASAIFTFVTIRFALREWRIGRNNTE